MVTVPTFTSLPNVAPTEPTAVHQEGVDRFQRADLEAPGEGLQKVGNAIDSDAMDASRIAASMATQQNENVAKAADTQSIGYASNLGYKSLDGQGGPAFYALKGQDAVNAQPQYIAALKAQVAQAAEGMPAQAKNAYLMSANARVQAEIDSSNRFTMLQSGVAATEASTARIGAASAASVNTYNDPAAIAANDKVITGEMADEGRRNGWAPEVLAQNTSLALSKSHADVIDTALGRGDTQAAAAAWNAYGKDMDAVTSVQTQAKLRGPLLDLHSKQQAEQILYPNGRPTGSMDQQYQQGSGYYDLVHGGEGNGVNGTTGASGPVQVIPSTAAAFHASPGHADIDINTEAGAREFTKWYGDQNAQKISAATGQPATNSQVVMAHLLGPEGAIGVLTHPDEPIGNHLTPAAISNNPGPLPGGSSATGAQAAASVSRYYAKAAGAPGNLMAGPGAPTAASVAASLPGRPDFEGAIGRVPATPNDPDLQQRTIQELERQKAQYDIGEKTDREAILKGGPGKPSLDDTLTAIRSGQIDTPVDELGIRKAFDSGTADKMMEQVQDAKAEGGILNAFKYATPDAISAKRQELQTRLTSGPPEGAFAAAKYQAQFEAAMTRNAEALKHDPASYVRQEPSVAALYAANTANPTPVNLAAAITRSEALQTSLGATPQAISTPAIDQITAKIHGAKVEEVPGIMDGLRQSYGAAWPDVYRDLTTAPKGKLDPAYQPLATMAPGAGRTDYAAALVAKDTKGEKFGASMEAANPLAKSTLETTLKPLMDPWQNSFPGASGDGVIEGQRQAIRTLATFYGDRGMDPATAAKTAFARVIGDTTDVQGSIRAPKTLNGSPFSADKVAQAGIGLTAGLKDADLQAGTTAAQARAGEWRTNPDGMSVSLQLKNTTGSWRLARRADGSPITMDYREVQSGKLAPSAATPLTSIDAIQ